MKIRVSMFLAITALAVWMDNAFAQSAPVTLSVEITVDGARLTKQADIKPTAPTGTAVGPVGTLYIYDLGKLRFTMPDGVRTIDVQPVVVYNPADRKAPYAFSDSLQNNRQYGSSTVVPPGATEWSELSKVTQKMVLRVGRKRYRLTQGFYTSCFLGDTRIRVLGGGETPIRDLVDGLYVMNPLTGKPIKIERVIRGPEPYALHAITVGGQRVVLTRDHPVPTRLGVKAASEIAIGDELLTEALAYEAVTAVEVLAPVPGTIVYNLRFNTSSQDLSDHLVSANGLVMGNQPMQALVERGERPGPLAVPARAPR